MKELGLLLSFLGGLLLAYYDIPRRIKNFLTAPCDIKFTRKPRQ